MDHDLETRGALIESTRYPHVMGGQADMVNRQILWLGNPGGYNLNRLSMWIKCGDEGYRLHWYT